jgi:hypothetical protein
VEMVSLGTSVGASLASSLRRCSADPGVAHRRGQWVR